MHVLILSTGYPTDYVPLDGIFYRDQAEALAVENMKVGVIAINPVSIQSVLKLRKLNFGYFNFQREKVNTYLYKYINIPKYPTYCVKVSLRKGLKLFKKYILENGMPDIIHVHCYESGALADKIKRLYKIPYVITEHSSKFGNNLIPKSMEKYARIAFENSELNIAVSEKFCAFLALKYKLSFQYIPNIVDTNLFGISTSKNSKPFVFFNAAGLNDNKNHLLLLQAFANHLLKFPNSILKIAGGGINELSLKNKVLELSIDDKVFFLGELSRENIKNELQQAHVFVLSSKIETFGVVLIEAMSCGLPVVSTKCGGPETIIIDEYLGELSNQDLASFSEAMQKCYENYLCGKYDSVKIRHYVETNFSNHAVASKLISVYQNVKKNYERTE